MDDKRKLWLPEEDLLINVFVDKIHDMQQRNVVSKEDQNAFSAWALGCAYATCGIPFAGSAHTAE